MIRNFPANVLSEIKLLDIYSTEKGSQSDNFWRGYNFHYVKMKSILEKNFKKNLQDIVFYKNIFNRLISLTNRE